MFYTEEEGKTHRPNQLPSRSITLRSLAAVHIASGGGGKGLRMGSGLIFARITLGGSDAGIFGPATSADG
jgi:hypothetical protein